MNRVERDLAELFAELDVYPVYMGEAEACGLPMRMPDVMHVVHDLEMHDGTHRTTHTTIQASDQRKRRSE